jgi:hypothetical protein
MFVWRVPSIWFSSEEIVQDKVFHGAKKSDRVYTFRILLLIDFQNTDDTVLG